MTAAVTGPRVAVVGAGISGLTAAYRLRGLLGPGAAITVLESRYRAGGVLCSVDLAGVPFDVGAEAFLARRPEVAALATELGLAEQLVHPSAATATIRAGGRTVGLPTGTVLGVPTSRARLEELLSAAAVATVAAERDRPLRWTPGADVGVGVLLRDRFGDEVADRLVGPLLGGVYAGRVDALGLRATAPTLAAALDAGAPSVTAAADRAVARTTADGPVFGAVRGGYRRLVDALAAGAELRSGTTVRALERTAGGWRLVLGSVAAPAQLQVDAVVLAVPAPALGRLLGGVAPVAAAAAAGIELASSVVVALAFATADTAALPETSGVLVAADEPLWVKAATYSSRKWDHLAPSRTDGLVRLRVSLGRAGDARTLQVDDAELLARVRADLAGLAGISAAPVAVHVQRWGGGLPQYQVGHLDRVAAIEGGLPAGIAVAGAALHGVGVPACIATADAAAHRVATHLRAAPG